jgi:hypothetical protein
MTSFPPADPIMRLNRLALAVTVLSLTAVSAVGAQQQSIPVKKDAPAATHSKEHMAGWKELDAYHMVMMGVWHPAKEKADLKPIRAKADSLALAADVWAKAAVPKACDSPDNRAMIARVNADSKALATLVKTGSDADVMAALKAVHDRFEVVNRGCKVGH